mgnify:CR=1 FL=1|jgi:hypothetical protein
MHTQRQDKPWGLVIPIAFAIVWALFAIWLRVGY